MRMSRRRCDARAGRYRAGAAAGTDLRAAQPRRRVRAARTAHHRDDIASECRSIDRSAGRLDGGAADQREAARSPGPSKPGRRMPAPSDARRRHHARRNSWHRWRPSISRWPATSMRRAGWPIAASRIRPAQPFDAHPTLISLAWIASGDRWGRSASPTRSGGAGCRHCGHRLRSPRSFEPDRRPGARRALGRASDHRDAVAAEPGSRTGRT